MSPGLHVVRAGVGPPLLLIHGSATDHTAWSIQLAGDLTRRFSLIAYDRRGGSVEDEAVDAASLITERTLVVGSSFGAVVALEVLRRHRANVAGAVLIEPPMGKSDDAPAAPATFLDEFDRIARTEGGPAAGEMFLRMVLGDAMYARIPTAFQERSKARWAEIRADSAALIAYRPRYAELRAIETPVQLVGGARSAGYFRPTLDALFATLPDSRLEIIPGAGHMLQAEAHRRFAEVVTAFAADVRLS
ncbi:alpha/beta hydrolase [soil metagenome]